MFLDRAMKKPSNRIRQLRKKKGLSQKQLADAAKTSQQQIQRIEVGLQNARFDLAARICAALEANVPEVFPTTEPSLSRFSRKGKKFSDILDDRAAMRGLEEAGIDMDPVERTFQYRLRGGAEGEISISGAGYSYLWSFVQDVDPSGFAVFNAGARKYAINLNHLLFCHFLHDPPDQLSENSDTDDDESHEVEFFLSDSAKAHKIDVAPDRVAIGDEDATGWEDVQLQGLFISAASDPIERFMLVDVDNETVFFRPQDVAMFSAPISAVEPALFSDDDEDKDKDKETRPRDG
jgi:transcriptional regulator with XRE-family HTH domain